MTKWNKKKIFSYPWCLRPNVSETLRINNCAEPKPPRPCSLKSPSWLCITCTTTKNIHISNGPFTFIWDTANETYTSNLYSLLPPRCYLQSKPSYTERRPFRVLKSLIKSVSSVTWLVTILTFYLITKHRRYYFIKGCLIFSYQKTNIYI